ncbi:MAG TPA: DUF1772 domain-containing protein [Blastocatellia bacterium]|nr:DUF1772 domain-containing protein [Blastocatellia bacterium]
MRLRVWRFITITLTALLMGMSLGHTLEMPMKMNVDGQLWLTFQHNLYAYFAIIGAPIELGAIITSIVLAVLVRKRRPAFHLTTVAAICIAVAFFLVWLVFTREVNEQTARWTAQSIPADWAEWRRQWEYSHAIRFVLHLMAFGALVSSVLFEIPKEYSGAGESEFNAK